ncbi:MAG: hypothetical protein ACTSYJ_00465 [Candidatus Thorarchaeota archaeon]
MRTYKHQTLFFAVLLNLFISSLFLSTDSAGLLILKADTAQPSSVVWSDDFENGTKTLSEWAVDDIYIDGETPITTNVTISNGLLYSSSYPNTSGMNILTHNSTTATGTWSVDVFLGESGNDHVIIVFMSPDWPDGYMLVPYQGYVLTIENGYGHYTLGYWEPDMAGAIIIGIDTAPLPAFSGWRHIDITRQPDDMMYVYIDGVLSLQGEDSRHHTSEYFRLWTRGSTIFDNITVSDTIDIDRAPPRWTRPLINHIINEGDDFRYALHADDYAGIDTWWVNDTANFVIYQEGILTSVSPLAAGNYTVEVFVNDTLGNVLSGAFYLEVIPATTTNGASLQLDSVLIVVISIGGLGVIVVAMVLKVRRK